MAKLIVNIRLSNAKLLKKKIKKLNKLVKEINEFQLIVEVKELN
jgi:hypothetical protein|tara:strand:- start:77 stop:208 length:132 start_codon:yes stop_codon:yes gene_type:complete